MTEEAKEEPVEEPKLEDIASEMGWSPKENWRGEESEWKDAATFIREGGKIQKHKADEVRALKKRLEDNEVKFTSLVGKQAQMLRSALETQRLELEAAKKKAFEDQDFEKFNKADKKIKEIEQAKVEEPENPRKQAFDEGFKDFRQKHDWYDSNRSMRGEAILAAQKIIAADPGISPEEYYEEIERAVKRAFPEEFQNQRRFQPGAVASGTSPARTSSKKDFDGLPAAAQKVWRENFMDEGVSKESYAKAYWSNNQE